MQRQFWLCIPPTVLCLLDQGLTLWYQPAEYWAGDYSIANEASPPMRWLLQQHPLAFEAGALVWNVLFCGVLCLLPQRAAMTVCIALVLGHTWGASTWIANFVPFGYWVTIGLFLASAILIVATWERYSAAEPSRK
jgi:hypothetical protein